VKRVIADGSVGSPHVRVGHRQAHNPKPALRAGFFLTLKMSKNRGLLCVIKISKRPSN